MSGPADLVNVDTASADPTAAITEVSEPLLPRSWSDFRTRYLAPTITTGALLLLVLGGGLTTPDFLTGDNLLNIVQVASLTGIIALGTTFITLSGTSSRCRSNRPVRCAASPSRQRSAVAGHGSWPSRSRCSSAAWPDSCRACSLRRARTPSS